MRGHRKPEALLAVLRLHLRTLCVSVCVLFLCRRPVKCAVLHMRSIAKRQERLWSWFLGPPWSWGRLSGCLECGSSDGHYGVVASGMTACRVPTYHRDGILGDRLCCFHRAHPLAVTCAHAVSLPSIMFFSLWLKRVPMLFLFLLNSLLLTSCFSLFALCTPLLLTLSLGLPLCSPPSSSPQVCVVDRAGRSGTYRGRPSFGGVSPLAVRPRRDCCPDGHLNHVRSLHVLHGVRPVPGGFDQPDQD